MLPRQGPGEWGGAPGAGPGEGREWEGAKNVGWRKRGSPPSGDSQALIFMIAREGRVRAGLRRQIRGGRGDRLDAGFLVIGDDRVPRPLKAAAKPAIGKATSSPARFTLWSRIATAAARPAPDQASRSIFGRARTWRRSAPFDCGP
jgi:hypothetical protein